MFDLFGFMAERGATLTRAVERLRALRDERAWEAREARLLEASYRLMEHLVYVGPPH